MYDYEYESDPLRRLHSTTSTFLVNPNYFSPITQSFHQTYEYTLRDEVLQQAVEATSGANLRPFSVHYTYDALGRWSSVGMDSPGAEVKPVGAEFDWNPVGQLEGIRRYDTFVAANGANQVGIVGITTTNSFDRAGRLMQLEHAGGATPGFSYQIQYAYDANSRVTKQTEMRPGLSDPKVLDYVYDELSQLESVDVNGNSTETYNYDDSGNRAGFTYDAQNRLSNDGTFSYTHDDEGNLTSKTRLVDDQLTTYEWDFRNRLAALTIFEANLSAKRIDYAYDMFDRRISKNILVGTWDGTNEEFDLTAPAQGGFTGFVYSGDQILFTRGAYNSLGFASDVFLPGPLGDSLAQDHGTSFVPNDSAGNLSWLLTDRLGSVRYVENSDDDSGAIDYDAFGNILGGSPSPAELRSLFGFTGHVHDAETGLGYFRARYYDPFTGRFLSEDPIGFAGGDHNLYRYVGNDPLNRTDPTGLSWLSEAFSFVKHVGSQIDDFVNDNGGWFTWFGTVASLGSLAVGAYSLGAIGGGAGLGFSVDVGAALNTPTQPGGAGLSSDNWLGDSPRDAPALLVGGADAQPLPGNLSIRSAPNIALVGHAEASARALYTRKSYYGDSNAPPLMLMLAHEWHKTVSLLEAHEQYINDLPRRIEIAKKQLGSGGHYAYVHYDNYARMQVDLLTAPTVRAELQMHKLAVEDMYAGFGFDDVTYEWISSDATYWGGKGIENVADAYVNARTGGMHSAGLETDVALGLSSYIRRTLAKTAVKSTVQSGAKAAAGVMTAGELRVAQYGHQWQKASLGKAIARHAGPNATSWHSASGKLIIENPVTGRQVVIDKAGYFRIFQPKSFGSQQGTYLDILGNVPAPARYLKGGAIRNIPLSGDDLNRATHFLIE